jgi:16S rRNA (guanine966-N2)-methyltransferase
MRIVGGQFKGQQLAAPKTQTVRPTSDRARESVFNILQHGLGFDIAKKRVLDLFAGTGALGCEALSRGASFCLFVDEAAEARGLIRRNIETLHLSGVTKLFRRDATRMGPCAPMQPYDLIFLDPPYNKGLGEKALQTCLQGKWLAEDALLVFEEGVAVDIHLPLGFTIIDERNYGEARLRFLQMQK